MRGIAGFFVGIVGIGVGVVSFIEARRNQKIADKLEQSIDTIASEQVVDIQQAIIDRAVERAVE